MKVLPSRTGATPIAWTIHATAEDDRASADGAGVGPSRRRGSGHHGRDTFGLKGIAISGYGTLEDVAESKAAGFAHHLVKPSRLKVLVDLVRRNLY